MGARRGRREGARVGDLVLLLFSPYGGRSYYFFSLWWPFSACGGLFFVIMGDLFWAGPLPCENFCGRQCFYLHVADDVGDFFGLAPPLGVPIFGLHKSKGVFKGGGGQGVQTPPPPKFSDFFEK